MGPTRRTPTASEFRIRVRSRVAIQGICTLWSPHRRDPRLPIGVNMGREGGGVSPFITCRARCFFTAALGRGPFCVFFDRTSRATARRKIGLSVVNDAHSSLPAGAPISTAYLGIVWAYQTGDCDPGGRGFCTVMHLFGRRGFFFCCIPTQVKEVGGGGREGARLGFEHNPRNLHFPNVRHHDRTGLLSSISNELASSISSDPKPTSRKLGASASYLDLAMEKAPKWEAGCLRSTDKVYHNDGHLKLPKDWLMTTSIVSIIRAELKQARYHINELKNERRSAKEKLNHFLRKLAVEKASRQSRASREHERVLNLVEVIKDDLGRERKGRKRVEIMNSKLVHELAEAKLLAKQYLQDYEKEKKERELIEEEELDEERRMLQMAEVWHEERVQMKLVDAKLMLEEKYAELSELQADLDAFLRAHSDSNGYMPLLKEAEGISSLFLKNSSQEKKLLTERLNHCCGYSPASHASKIHTLSPETDIFLENPMKMRDEDHSELESMSYAEGQGYCNSPEVREAKNHSLKAKLLEARMENQKIQLCNVLKHYS
ncbi:hypothetical protein OPV22_021890 [Ensete ventricosum]|uniref:Uncharacterized protein n=1 Tax=Ensete ventricosum TaxID=4639 RepID=A0AAV8QNJ1_ENSVE|nr:hypothetical protein OPV22_021890 [Ensete ventricosum]